MSHRNVNNILKFLISCLLVGYTFLSFKANLDLSAGRFVLFMDERITFDGVRGILHADNLIIFFERLMDGGDHRYGRSLWNSMALISFLPNYFWGEMGQIFASRMLQVILLISSFIILSKAAIKSWSLRSLLILLLVSMPYCAYYMTMPKPEPLQLFFLALFFYCYQKNNFAFGKSWIFLGLAFGTKISTLPVIFVIIFSTIFIHKIYSRNRLLESKAIEGFLFFLLGFGVAVPILLFPILVVFTLFKFFCWIFSKKEKLNEFKPIFLGLSILPSVFIALPALKIWVLSTFMYTSHGSDQEKINFFSWVIYFYEEWLIAPMLIGIALSVIAGGLFYINLKDSISHKTEWPLLGSILMMSGLALNISIFIGTHRLWGFYLFPGSVLFLAGLLSLIDGNSKKRLLCKVQPLALMQRLMFSGPLIILLAMSIFFWVPSSISTLKDLSLRTTQKEYGVEFNSYIKVINALEKINEIKAEGLKVAFDPILFPPDNNPRYTISEFWGPYTNWDSNPDVIIFSKVHTPAERKCLEGSVSYSACVFEEKLYKKLVINSGDKCKYLNCYERYTTLPNGGEILVLRHAN